MKHAKLLYAALPALVGLNLLISTPAEARGMMHGLGFGMMGNVEHMATRLSDMFSLHAQMLGVSVDEVKNAWAQGKTIHDLAKEKNITQEQLQQRMKSAHEQQMKTQMQTLVSKGIITQAQADARLKTVQAKATTMMPSKGIQHMKHHGFHW